MKRKIFGFRKTDHFLYRQWDRKISDELLLEFLNQNLLVLIKEKCCVIVSREIVKKHTKLNKELFVIIKGNLLITCFLEDLSLYSSKNNKGIYFLLVN